MTHPAHDLHPTRAAAGAPKILVVEDNYLTSRTVCDMVEACGYAVAGTVAQVESGLAFLAKADVDGALVDLNLNGKMSFPLCAELRRRHVPFTFLTAYPTSVIPPAFRDAPLLAKPIDRDRMRATLVTLTPPTAAASIRGGNLLLETLAEEDWQLLEPCLEPVALHAGDVLEHPGDRAPHIVFPQSGAVSIAAGTLHHRIEVALVGREGLVGVGALLDGGTPSTHATVLFAGHGSRMSSRDLRLRLRQSPRLHDRLLRHVDGLLREVYANALAIGRATVEQRVARWLLVISDRLGTSEVPVTHDSMAAVLGVRRSSVTVALHALEGRHVIRSRRGRVQILARPLLVEETAGFYGADARGDQQSG